MVLLNTPRADSTLMKALIVLFTSLGCEHRTEYSNDDAPNAADGCWLRFVGNYFRREIDATENSRDIMKWKLSSKWGFRYPLETTRTAKWTRSIRKTGNRLIPLSLAHSYARRSSGDAHRQTWPCLNIHFFLVFFLVTRIRNRKWANRSKRMHIREMVKSLGPL